MQKKEALLFYTKQGERTQLSKESYSQFPKNLPEIVGKIQGLLIHPVRVDREGVSVSENNKKIRNPFSVEDILSKINLTDIRSELPLEKRAVGICRNFSMLLTSILRESGIPSRTRCGFATYFPGGVFEDHWICEYWDSNLLGWVRVDPQMDEYWRNYLKLKEPFFDHLKLKKGQYFVGGEVWKFYRAKLVDPDICGFYPEKKAGEYFIRGNMLRDFFALNKIEYTYQETSRLMREGEALSKSDLRLLDLIAYVTADPDKNFTELRGLFENRKLLRP